MAAIVLEDVSVEFPIFTGRGRSLKSEVLRQTVGTKIDHSEFGVQIRALDGISLRLAKETRLGVIGGNGSGKTTLLRVMSKVYPPTHGLATITGRVNSLTDLMLGMDEEATGYENIVLRGVIMGLRRAEIQAKLKDIEEFTGLAEYLDLPIRTYSTGMKLRLAFAVTTSVDPEILIMDELIGAGDADFIERASRKVAELIDKASILVLASHNLDILRQFCSAGLWLDGGRIVAHGPLSAVLDAYLRRETAAPTFTG